MASLLNFDNVSFPGRLQGMKKMFSLMTDSDYTPSEYAKEKFKKGGYIRTMDVIYETLRAYKGDSTPNRFVGEVAGGYASEIPSSDKTQVTLLCSKKDGSFYIKGGVIDEDGIITSMKEVNHDNKVGVMLALMPVILSDSEAKDIYDKMSDYLEWDPDSDNWIMGDSIQDFGQLLNRFSSNVEERINRGNIKVDVDSVSPVKGDDLKKVVTKTFIGQSRKFKQPEVKAAKEAEKAPNNDFVGKYAYDPNRVFTPEEENLKAKVPAKYVMPDFVPEICELFKGSTNFPAPMRVAYLIGPAGTGKTEAANAIFAGLGLPGDHYTCNPSTEIFDFLGQVFPATGSDKPVSFEQVRKELGLPDTEDVVFDPEAAYRVLYGKDPETIPDPGQLIIEMINRVMQKMKENGCGKNFRYVESGLIRAARMGYGFEIQEIGCVLRPGVAVGLNALLETGGNAFITLPTGDVIRKHPDATFIFTSNDEYAGTCNLNQSVLDRMALVYRIDNPRKETMKERIMARLAFPDAGILDRMIDVIFAVSKAAKESGIDDGVCGYRSLENWAMSVMIKSKTKTGTETGYEITDAIVYKTALTAVMNKASQKKEFVDELMSSLTTQFASPDLT